MSYKRVVKKNGKVYGPYVYESYRDENGKVKKRYLGPGKKKSKKINSKYFVFGVLIILSILATVYTIKDYISGEDFVGVITGFSVGGLDNSSESGLSASLDEPKEEQVVEDSGGGKNSSPEEKLGEVLQGEVAGENISEPIIEIEEENNETNEMVQIPLNETTVYNVTENKSIDNVEALEVENQTEILNETNETVVLENQTIVDLNQTQENDSKEINQTPQNQTEILNETNETVVLENQTIENSSLVNQTLVSSIINLTNVSALQYKAIVGRPVRWIKRINATSENLSVEIPKSAVNISVLTDKEVEKALSDLGKYENLVEKSDKEDFYEGSVITGNVVGGIRERQGILKKFWKWLTGFTISGNVVLENDLNSNGEIVETSKSKVVNLTKVAKDTKAKNLAVEYYTQAPESYEANISNGKRVVVDAPSELNYTDVLAYALIDSKISMNDSGLKVLWYEDSGDSKSVANLLESGRDIGPKQVDFKKVDFDSDGYVDYVEWVVPHFSSQVYEIVYITRAEHLDENRTFLEDVYTEVSKQDGVYSKPINEGEYLRVWFEKYLKSNNDITIYAKSSGVSDIIVYEKNGSEEIATFKNVGEQRIYKIYLDGLAGSQDTFDLRIVGDSVEFDYVTDPTPITLAIPQTFNVQGKLSNSSGPLNGTYEFNFSIYDAYTAGNLLWWDNLSVTTDSNGIYSVVLNVTGLNFSQQYYLGIAVEGDPEMTPRLNLTSSPYAFMAQHVYSGGIIFDENLDASGYNITADYFIGDGSGLTNLPGSSSGAGWENDSINTNTSLNVNIDGNVVIKI